MLFDKIDYEKSIFVEVIILIPPPFLPPVFFFTLIVLKLIESDSSICIPPALSCEEFSVISKAENSIFYEFYIDIPPAFFLA